jgi:choice-of-anchor C domain-containing protein
MRISAGVGRISVAAGLTALVSSLSMGAAGAASPNLVTNGSFESPADASSYVVYPAGSTGITGWTVGQGSISNASTEQDSTDEWPADTGSVSVDLSGTAPGDIYQDVATTPGTVYALSFAIGGNFYCGQTLKTMQITWGSTVFTTQFSDVNSSQSNMNWQHDTIQVTASSTTTRIDFADVTPDQSSCGATLDSVSLVATPAATTPEAPVALLLPLSGGAVIAAGAAIARRRRRRCA